MCGPIGLGVEPGLTARAMPRIDCCAQARSMPLAEATGAHGIRGTGLPFTRESTFDRGCGRQVFDALAGGAAERHGGAWIDARKRHAD